MSRKEKSIELLNKAVADELLAVHQYMYFHFRCDDMGYDLLSGLFKRTAIQEMMHVEQLSERILFLKGEVEMKTSGDVQKIHEPKEMLELATAMEEGSVNDYNAWAQECAANADAVSKKLFETLVAEEEVHQAQPCCPPRRSHWGRCCSVLPLRPGISESDGEAPSVPRDFRG